MPSQEGAKALLVKLPLRSPRSPPSSEMERLQQSRRAQPTAHARQQRPAAASSHLSTGHLLTLLRQHCGDTTGFHPRRLSGFLVRVRKSMREDSALVDGEKHAGYSHLSLRGIRRTSDRKLMEAAAGRFCFVHHEHLERREESRRQSADG